MPPYASSSTEISTQAGAYLPLLNTGWRVPAVAHAVCGLQVLAGPDDPVRGQRRAGPLLPATHQQGRHLYHGPAAHHRPRHLGFRKSVGTRKP